MYIYICIYILLRRNVYVFFPAAPPKNDRANDEGKGKGKDKGRNRVRSPSAPRTGAEKKQIMCRFHFSIGVHVAIYQCERFGGRKSVFCLPREKIAHTCMMRKHGLAVVKSTVKATAAAAQSKASPVSSPTFDWRTVRSQELSMIEIDREGCHKWFRTDLCRTQFLQQTETICEMHESGPHSCALHSTRPES